MTADVNVADAERWASALGGAALTAYGIKRLKERNVAGAMLAVAGGTMIYRAATGHCPVYAATGISTTASEDTRYALSGSGGILIEDAVTINRRAEEVYDVWHDFEQLPKFMRYLESVRVIDER